MLSVIQSGAVIGVDAVAVQVEVNSGEAGDPRFILVGLPDASVKEAQDRVFSALANTGFRPPMTRTIVNLAPGDLRKEGPMYDLPIALGTLFATRQAPCRLQEKFLVAGELSLSGETRPIKGALSLALLARKMGNLALILPPESAREAAFVEGVQVYAVSSLREAVEFLSNKITLRPVQPTYPESNVAGLDFAEVKGQAALKRAIEVSVAGGHNLLMIGPPGAGKSMVAKCIPSIMPKPNLDELIEILCIHSAAGNTLRTSFTSIVRPFRAPHHTISDVGLIGGGTIPGPGEISLAHNGVLFLDELPEFRRSVLEVLRQPLEDRHVTISRSAGKVTLPSFFMLVAAMNPCPCGFYGDKTHTCRCTVPIIQRYRSRVSGPLLDRIDIHIEVPAVTFTELRRGQPEEPSAVIRERIEAARQRQNARVGPSRCNAQLEHAHMKTACALNAQQECLLQRAMEQLGLSARSLNRVLKVARTIADLAASELIQDMHLLEALQYRTLDRKLF